MKTPTLSIVGRSESGKTTLIEKLVPELKKRGYRIGTIKHHAHAGFDIDHPGKDSWRHAQAGSDHVIIAAPDQIASIRKLQRELTLNEIVDTMTEVDLVITDGYKSAGAPKIEVVRAARSQQTVCQPEELIAVVSDLPLDLSLPHFDLEDIEGLAQFICNRFLPSRPKSSQ